MYYDVVAFRFGSELERVRNQSKSSAIKIALDMIKYYGSDTIYILEFDSVGNLVDVWEEEDYV